MSEKPIPTIEGSEKTPDPKQMEQAFPNVNPGQAPYGGRVIVQLRRLKKDVAMGHLKLILPTATRENEKWNNMIGKVVAIGPLAFKNKDTMASWPEGSWAEIGDYVRVPRWGGDRWERNVLGEDEKDPVLFMTLNDHELIAKVTDNPLSFRTYI